MDRSPEPISPRAGSSVAGPDMLWIPGGPFMMGSDNGYPEEAPARLVSVDDFWIARTPVTNREFAAFVCDAGYTTVAERALEIHRYPDLSVQDRQPASSVFMPPEPGQPAETVHDWWRYVPGADWRHPLGPHSSVHELDDHPVVHVTLADAEAYAEWAGATLPTEAEWEFAARGGLDGAEFAWGERFTPDGQYMANTWQGEFPRENLLRDGWLRTSPVGAFPANGYGLYDMIGNVWEWTSDWWSIAGAPKAQGSCCAPSHVQPAGKNESIEPGVEGDVFRKVLKGGSHLCAPSYCRRYRPAARHPQSIDSGTSHIGFRCIVRSTSGDIRQAEPKNE